LYLTVARTLGLHGTVNELVGTIAQRVFSETGLNAPVSFAQTGNAFEEARLRLAEEIALAVSVSRPSVSEGGIVNGASFAGAPAPVAPGSIVSIFGVNLSSSTALAGALPLPTKLGGTTATVNGVALPLFYVSPNQVNAQLPFEVPPGAATAIVANESGVSRAVTFNVADAAVGIFTHPNSNRAAALNEDGAANGPDSPEARGEDIVVFLTGQGLVDNAVPTGQAAPLTPLSRATLPYAATVAGNAATVSFVGLTPGFAGLAQANINIPAGIEPGSQVPVSVSVNGVPGNTVFISVK
jgi:adhesin/invasin